MIVSLLAARFRRVLRLLDQERKILLEGPLSDLTAVGEEREALLTELIAEEEELPAAFVAALKAKAERNRRIILARLAGVRAAEAQVARIDPHSSRRSYSAKGADRAAPPARIAHDARA